MPSTLLDQLTWPDVRDTSYSTAILPWGATEAHNLHLPHGTDTFQAEAVARLAAEKATVKGAAVIVLPTVPFGVHTQQKDLPLTLNMNPSTQHLVLKDLLQSVEKAGVRHMVVLNGHGANSFRQMIRELQASTTVFLCEANWWTLGDANSVFDEPGDHAGELETSVMMHLHPEIVRPLEEAGEGHGRSFRIKALREKRVWAPRKWTQVTDDTGVGNPALATPEKGAQFLDQVTTELADFLVDLESANPKDLYA
ncbi:MAG: creatininase family protein [Bacteroidetes bacterium]|nr:creatininase family protein [Bacteroidota bacterium]